MQSATLTQPGAPAVGLASGSRAADQAFSEVYERHFAFVWRSVRRLGIGEQATEDVVQDVFLVVHRRLPDFEGRSSIKTWLFAIILRVVRNKRRSYLRERAKLPRDHELDVCQLPDRAATPLDAVQHSEAVQLLYELLDRLDDPKREVFVLADLEQLTVPEIAEVLSINTNTAYSRLRAARQAFNRAVERHRARRLGRRR